MSCKDCIHEKVCGYYAEFEDEADDCPHFKNKADFVEVVRCKDCNKFIEKGEEYLLNKKFGVCEKSRTGFFDDGEEVYEDDFCSYGERK